MGRISFFDHNGNPLAEGELLVQKDLAKTFSLIAEKGAEVFYQGEIGQAIAETVQEHNGSMTLTDLEQYQISEHDPIWGNYQGYHIATMPPPSSGGLTMLQLLNMAEELELTQYDVRSSEKYHYLAEGMRLAYADRGAYMGDPEYVDVPKKGLLAPEYISERSRLIEPDRASEAVQHGDPWQYEGREAPSTAMQVDDKKEGETTHFTVADQWGNFVSYTTTIEQVFGSGLVVDDYGIVLNNELTDFDAIPGGANEVQPGKRPLSSMTPTIVFNEDGRLFMTVGSPGGATIISSVMHVILHVIGYELTLKDAIEEPRIYNHATSETRWESGVPEDARAILLQMGHQLEQASVEIGNVNSIIFDSQHGLYIGAADSTREGVAIGLDSTSEPDPDPEPEPDPDPDPDPDPQPDPDSEQDNDDPEKDKSPAPGEGDDGSGGSKKPATGGGSEQEGSKLPDTATNYYLWLAIGSGLLLLAGVILFIKRRKNVVS